MSLFNLIFNLQLTVYDVFGDGVLGAGHGNLFEPGGVASIIWGSHEPNPFYDAYGSAYFPSNEGNDYAEMNKAPPPDAVEKGGHWKSNLCFMSIQNGTCKRAVTRWAYDISGRKCIKFIYTGCGGNSNNFITEKRCNEVCVFTPVVADCERYDALRRMIGTVLEGIPEDC